MMPTIALNFHRIHDKLTEILEVTGGTFLQKGVWFTNTDKIFTCDPANAHYILSQKFDNFEKGEEAKKIFDVHGDMLFNADHDEWRKDRKMVRAFFNDRRCIQATVKLVRDNLEKGLIPVFEHVIAKGEVVDLQDLFTRLMLDSTCTLVTGYNPSSLSIGFPDTPLANAMDVANDRILQRHFIPGIVWRTQRWLNVGGEKTMAEAKRILDGIATNFIQKKGEDIKGQVEGFDALKFFMTGEEGSGSKPQPYNVLRDVVVVLNAGGRDTTGSALTWIIWLLSQNPSVEEKIRKELEATLPEGEAKMFRLFNIEELNKLPYLHAAFCETLRLYPPAPFQQRVVVQPDTLPSGHRVTRKMEVIFSWYALGRMKSIWGSDALEFKPERWLSEKGEIKHDLANKYLMAFSAGPRVCPGKNDAFTRMKAIAAAVIHNYNVKVVEGHKVTPAPSIGLRMNDGLMVNITRRRT